MINEKIWEREMIKEEKRLKRIRQVFIQKVIVFSLCSSIIISGIILFCNTFVEAKEAISKPIIEAEQINVNVSRQPAYVRNQNIPENISTKKIHEPDIQLVDREVISQESLNKEATEKYVYNISEDDKLLFKKIISAESYSFWSYQDCLSLATVVINRLNSETFPHSSSIREILTTKSQFETYSNGRYNEVDITKAADDAVEAVLKGKTNLNSNVMYFCTAEYYDVCSTYDFFKSNLDDPVYQVRNVLFFEEP